MTSAEQYFQRSGYWRAWADVPDNTPDISYAMKAVDAADLLILDVPCGRGRLLKAVASIATRATLYGLDVNEATLALLRKDVSRARPACASIYALPFEDRRFDVVLCHESFMHFEDPDRAAAELCRVAGDRVYISVTTKRQLNTLLRRYGMLGPRDVPHWTYNIEDVVRFMRSDFDWTVTGAFLIGRKALRCSVKTHSFLHNSFGRWIPQSLLRRFGQTLFLYGKRRR